MAPRCLWLSVAQTGSLHTGLFTLAVTEPPIPSKLITLTTISYYFDYFQVSLLFRSRKVERIWSFLRLRFFQCWTLWSSKGWEVERSSWEKVKKIMKSRQRWMKCKLDRETGGRSMEKKVASILTWHVAESKWRRFKAILDYTSASM